MPVARFRRRPRAVVLRSGRKSRFVRHMRRRFAKRVKQVILRTNEAKNKKVSTGDGIVLQEGNGTSRNVYILSPLTSIIQGTRDDNFIGDSIWVKGVALRGQISSVNPYTQFHVRFTLIWSRLQNDYSSSFVRYDNTTTSSANPTALAPLSNIPLFDSTGLPFVGDGYVIPFDTHNNIKVLGSKTIHVDAHGGPTSVAFKKFKIWFPIKKRFQYIDVGEDSSLGSAPNYGKYGNYYIIRQTIALANSVSSTQVGTMDQQVDVYFKDP